MIKAIFFWVVVAIHTLILVLPAIVASLVDKSGRLPEKICRYWARVILKLARVKVSVEMEEPLNGESPLIYISNHQSWFDVFALMAYLPTNARFVAKKSLEYIPLFGVAMRAVGTVIIDRNKPEQARELLMKGAEKQFGGARGVIIFPEGTRSRDGKLGQFKKGAFVLAIQTGIPLVPVGVSGSRSVLPAGGFKVSAGEIKIKIGKQIETSGLKLGDKDRLMEKARKRILELAENVESVENAHAAA